MDTNMSVTCHKFQHPLDYKNIKIREAPLKNVVLSNGAQGTVYVKDNTTVVKVQPYFSSDPNEAVNQCNASKAGIAPIVKDSYVFKNGESENQRIFEAIESERLDVTLQSQLNASNMSVVDTALLELTRKLVALGDGVCDIDLHANNVMLRMSENPPRAFIIDWDPMQSGVTQAACDKLYENTTVDPENIRTDPMFTRGPGMVLGLLVGLRDQQKIPVESKFVRTVKFLAEHGMHMPEAPKVPDPWDD